MSKLVSIIEGQSSKQFNNADYLRTSLQGGGYCDWVPEDDRILKSKSVTKNGTYKSVDDGAFGYDEFTVNVPKKDEVTGKKPNGNEATVSRDDDGYLKETGVPSSIRITTNPSKMTYADGETIDMSGAVIKAYNADGSLWGNVPLNEVVISPSSADITKFDVGVLLDGEPVHYATSSGHSEGSVEYVDYIYETSPIGTLPLGGTLVYGNATITTVDTMWDDIHLEINGVMQPARFTEDYFPAVLTRHIYKNKVGTPSEYWSTVAYIALRCGTIPVPSGSSYVMQTFGTATITHTGSSGETIEVKWRRPGDNEELKTSFSIIVS